MRDLCPGRLCRGSTGYYSYLSPTATSPVKSLEDFLKNGKQFTFGNGDPNSTSGNLVPGFFVFAKNGIDPKSHFKVMTTANHGSNLAAVLNKQVDVATNNSEEIGKLKGQSPEKAEQIRIIWTSPEIPPIPLVWRKDLPMSEAEDQGLRPGLWQHRTRQVRDERYIQLRRLS